MNSSFIVTQVFSVQDERHAEIVSIGPGYEKMWAIPLRVLAAAPGSGPTRFIPQVGSDVLSEFPAQTLDNHIAGQTH